MNTESLDLPVARKSPPGRAAHRRRFALIWLVPLVAAGTAAWLVYKNVRQTGPVISIQFAEGKGLQPGQTLIRYRGVRVGDVQSVQLAKDGRSVEVRARLERAAAQLAREGSQFWIVRADMTAGTMRGLDTLVGGPYIQLQPGQGRAQKKFIGLEEGPVVVPADGGLDITLTWPRLGWLNPGAPVYYRGVEVGMVQDYSLGDFATNIVIHAHIRRPYARLVRTGSKFWNAGGIRADVSFFKVSVSAESLKSALVGGIAFATPDPPGPISAPPAVFPLQEKPEDKWLKWSPAIETEVPSNSPPNRPLKLENTIPAVSLDH